MAWTVFIANVKMHHIALSFTLLGFMRGAAAQVVLAGPASYTPITSSMVNLITVTDGLPTMLVTAPGTTSNNPAVAVATDVSSTSAVASPPSSLIGDGLSTALSTTATADAQTSISESTTTSTSDTVLSTVPSSTGLITAPGASDASSFISSSSTSATTESAPTLRTSAPQAQPLDFSPDSTGTRPLASSSAPSGFTYITATMTITFEEGSSTRTSVFETVIPTKAFDTLPQPASGATLSVKAFAVQSMTICCMTLLAVVLV
ncbi:hypothetical protein EMMF5_003907 [Cystobasidiomycetes sp. EMM_F5]